MIVCAGRMESFGFARSIGVGLVESAINLTKIVLEQKPKELIFIGSAGSYDFSLKLLDIFISDCATQIEGSVLDNSSYTPLENKIDLSQKSFQSVSHETLQKFPKVIVNSSNYITTNINQAKMMLEREISLENMEFFSVLQVAKEFQIPCFGVFCVSNYTNPQAHQDFLSHHKDVMERLRSIVEL